MKPNNKMKNFFFHFFLLISICFFSGCKAQSNFGESYLQLCKSISLSEIKGRIDHLDINSKKQIVYIAALGNNALEVMDVNKGKVLHMTAPSVDGRAAQLIVYKTRK